MQDHGISFRFVVYYITGRIKFQRKHNQWLVELELVFTQVPDGAGILCYIYGVAPEMLIALSGVPYKDL